MFIGPIGPVGLPGSNGIPGVNGPKGIQWEKHINCIFFNYYWKLFIIFWC